MLKLQRATTIIRKDDEVLINDTWMPVSEVQIGQRVGGAKVRRLTNYEPRSKNKNRNSKQELREEPLRKKFGSFTRVPRAANYSQLDETGATFRLLRPEELMKPNDEYISLTNIWAPMHDLLIGKPCGGLYVRRRLESYFDVKNERVFNVNEWLTGDKVSYMGQEVQILTMALEGLYHIGVLWNGEIIQFNKDGQRRSHSSTAPRLMNEGGKNANPTQGNLL